MMRFGNYPFAEGTGPLDRQTREQWRAHEADLAGLQAALAWDEHRQAKRGTPRC